MIISHKHKFIFIHITKCAGSSITHALVPELGENDIVLGVTPEGEKLSEAWKQTKGIHKHSKAKEVKEFLEPEIWDNYFKFTFVRNPWDMLVSTYHWWLKTSWDDQEGTGQKIKSLNNFEEYLSSPYRRRESCTDFVFDDGKMIVDFVGKHETIYKDFAYICGRVGLPNLKLPRRNASDHKEYFQYYTNQENIDLVAEWFKDDVQNFKYFFKKRI